MSVRTLTLSAAAAVLLCACGGATSEAPAPGDAPQASVQSSFDTAPSADYTEIVWDDLMPEGEFERLDQLYGDFYAKLEADMKKGQQSLMEAGTSGDVASLIEEGSADDSMEQIGTFNVVEDLDGKPVRIPGYVVPFDFSAESKHSEFLLVPYFGACLHTPPPPPNQMLFVRADPPAKVDSIYEPVWLEGTLSTGEFRSDLGDSAYEMTLSKIEPYNYE